MAPTALLSVSDKRGLVPLAEALHRLHGFRLLSSGGTASALEAAGLPVTRVAEHTGAPEILGGRVKTLHPRVHGGILAKRDDPSHQADLAAQAIDPIDVVVVNLYPFRETVADPAVSWATAIENIDIGGPAMVRAAAKNHADVAVLTSPSQYDAFLAALASGRVDADLRRQLALEAFRHTASYDSAISTWMAARPELANPEGSPIEEPALGAGEPLRLELPLQQSLRYGENPHQPARWYSQGGAGWGGAIQLQGKELSYNNLIDLEAALATVREFGYGPAGSAREPNPGLPAAVVVKHTNPCGVGIAATAAEAFLNGKATDPVSAFGGIIAFSGTVDGTAAREIAEMFAEVIIAPEFSAEAREVLGAKKNLRVLLMPIEPKAGEVFELRRISGGVLVQEKDRELLDEEKFEIVSERKPTQAEMRGLRLGWAICKHVKSNAIVYAAEHQLVGVGAGQMSRVDSVRIGAMKAQLPLSGSVLASDAFFPFRDGLDEAASHGITAVIQPGGSVRDKEVIQAANEHGIAMVFTGMRHFKH